MRSINKGLRRVGIVGLSTLVATSMMTLSAVTASAIPPAYTALTAPNVARAAAQPAGSLTLDFTNSFATNAEQSFTISGNNCATAPGIAAATGFTGAGPTGALTGPFLAGLNTAGTATVPTFTTTLSSSSAQCATALVKDVVTLKLTTPSSVAGPTDWFKYTLGTVAYDVGSSAPVGNIDVATSGVLRANASVVNAVVAGATYTNTAKVLAVPAATGVTLGTQTLVENNAGTFFAAASTPRVVTLTLSGSSVFTAGITPTITVPTGYTVTALPTAALGTYSFTVTTGATPVAATMTISGLTITAGAAADTTLTISAPGAVTVAPVKVVRIVDYTARTGGATRYETAAALFNSKFTSENDVVLSSGALFPDALSANYLAGRLGTGTLLTTPASLSTAARQAIITAGVKRVFITGETGAVSKTVENQIEALHVGNVPTAAFITTVRLGGIDRYATNKLVNENNFVGGETTVLLASGLNFPDALALGPVASKPSNTMPLILTRGATLGASEIAQLSDFHPTNVVIAGGTGVVSQAIETSLIGQGFTVLRLAGQDRTQTAAAVAAWATVGVTPFTGIRAAQGFVSSTTYIATGSNFADALAAGPVAGANNQLIVLTKAPTLLGLGIPEYLGTKTVSPANDATHVGILHALGLTGAVSSAVMQSAAVSIG